MKFMPHVEREVEAKLLKKGLKMVKRSSGYQHWQEEKHNEMRELSVFFMRGVNGGPFGNWTKACTRDVSEAKDLPPHAHLFIVVGGKIEDSGEGNIYVSNHLLKLPKMITPPVGIFVNHLMKEKHSLRHGDRVEVCEVTTPRGIEYRGVN